MGTAASVFIGFALSSTNGMSGAPSCVLCQGGINYCLEQQSSRIFTCFQVANEVFDMVLSRIGFHSLTGNRKLDIVLGLVGAFLWIMKVISDSRRKNW